MTPFPVLPESGVWPLKTAADFRDALHRLVAALTLVAGSYHVLDANSPILVVWVPAVLGIVDAIVARQNSVDGSRRIVYAAGALLQLILVAVGVATDQQAVLIVGLVVTVVISTFASAFTVTSPIVGENAAT